MFFLFFVFVFALCSWSGNLFLFGKVKVAFACVRVCVRVYDLTVVRDLLIVRGLYVIRRSLAGIMSYVFFFRGVTPVSR